MKKVLIIMLLACLALLALAACGEEEACVHTYDNACDTTCNLCQAPREITHDLTAATCTAPKTCTVCGATSGEALGHTTTDDGDCTTALSCSRCTQVIKEAKADHVTRPDDGDCGTAVKCVFCEVELKSARPQHTPEEDDGDCTTEVKCTHCDEPAVLAKSHDPETAWAWDAAYHWHACKNEGCDVACGKEAHDLTSGSCTTCGAPSSAA